VGSVILREARPKHPPLVVVRPKGRILRTLSRGEPANSQEEGHPERRIQPFDVLRLRLRTGARSAAVSLRTALKTVILSEGSPLDGLRLRLRTGARSG
jgi:hypothetical protein